jgi:hypothetical protein
MSDPATPITSPAIGSRTTISTGRTIVFNIGIKALKLVVSE